MIEKPDAPAEPTHHTDPGLRGADTWIFDLDNTLYPAACNLFQQVDQRMGGYISQLLDIAFEDARALQKGYFRQYGTTLRGLMEHHGADPHAFLAFVHDIDYSPIPSDAALGAALDRLPGRKLIFTNGTVSHAEAVLDRLGIANRFDGIFDIVAADFVPKPNAAPYHRMVADHEVTADRAVMVEDIAQNLIVPAELGMRTVWVRTDHEWSHGAAGSEHVHHEIEDLTDWLTSYVEALDRDEA